MSLHFTSDLHLGHRKVAEIRGFDSTAEHDAAIVDAWRSTVNKDDHVWVLGDIAVSSPRYALSVIAELPGVKHLIWGNHDGGHPMHRNSHSAARQYLDVFASTSQSARRRINGREVLLSHFPYERDRDVKRHAQWRLPDLGVPLLHGHTHGIEQATASIEPDGRVSRLEVHVGLDAWNLTPVSLEVVAEQIEMLA